ncbi:lysylphosphatidylglycerol synthetase-like protein (DUF2156 family) [Clostridium saccharoperbutylacetonicum]|uniref:Uncharacterized protein n=1 Tax=Clostridium saccharoperbutylacetonicum N1-4(HMT) TaxID=931276 RepID=M1MVB1_9CLOT|nr:hypothetical protein [Clostridium saccharoperbutylacetonicum]AGF55452.1 hypothetical protein Cspa_c16820 [Clostridium saccharoperbutylacetonicum N1-4(HMT)]NRT63833.1 lysylphosphatidylglycerol synthetase-like protein (DUF2156 family) [Clostridium saccharoperbutylacetonicum]NSB27196.1 lysylphosphatidylglycerol synthetase-like protein (DUF2156 family) [Clostridium saccharoperbutylacetonicum]NSB40683.1 lysylphosphatidylglycerol synthetase-like protein (DUF2156 family) [Clostridium saccharoperbut
MKKVGGKFTTLLELIRGINILNLTLILSMILSIMKINKYIVFVVVMLISTSLMKLTQKIIDKQLNGDKSIFQSKFFVFVSFIFNISFLVYFIYIKEYIMITLFSVLFIGSFILKKLPDIRNRFNYGE